MVHVGALEHRNVVGKQLQRHRIDHWGNRLGHRDNGQFVGAVIETGLGVLVGEKEQLAPTCTDCVFRPHCRGVPAGYADLYGVGELEAVSAEHAAQLDPRVGRWLRTGWRPGRDAPVSDERSLARVVKLAGRVRRGGPYAGWTVTKVASTSPQSASVTLSRDDAHIAVKIQARPGQRPPVKVSFGLPDGVPESALRAPVDAVSRVLRG